MTRPVGVDILCTNDDGWRSVGLYPLVRRLAETYTVAVVAPDGPRSWVGKSITAHAPVTLREEELNGIPVSVLTGSPADCVQVALYEVLAETPRLVVSGINIGANVGQARILSSGTVGAAIEAAIDGVPAIASSLRMASMHGTDFFDPQNYTVFENAAAITARVVDRVLAQPWDPAVDVLNLNVPPQAGPDTPVEVTRPFIERYGRLFARDGDVLAHLHPTLPAEAPEGTDLHALLAGRASLTPMSLSLVAEPALSRLAEIFPAV